VYEKGNEFVNKFTKQHFVSREKIPFQRFETNEGNQGKDLGVPRTHNECSFTLSKKGNPSEETTTKR